jgi:hypothetical protein
MIQFIAKVEQFGAMGEKTGWTYIHIPAPLAQELFPGNKKSFRVKGKLDHWAFEQLALIPMGEGDFILALNSQIRKQIKKNKGATLKVEMTLDTKPVAISADLLACLEDEPRARAYFDKLPGSHKLYYSRWFESAKSDETKSRRIAKAITALSKEMGFGEMLREEKQENDQLGR